MRIKQTIWPKCPECGAVMNLRSSPKYKYRDGTDRPFYGTIPACKCTHGAHPDGRPLGIPCNRETKDVRIRLRSVVEKGTGRDAHQKGSVLAPRGSARNPSKNVTSGASTNR